MRSGSSPSSHRRFDATRRELLAARAERQARIDAGELPDFLPETRDVRDGDWRVAPVPRRPPGPPRRDHRPGRPQDGHQRAQLRRALLHGRLRGRQLADLAKQPRRAGQPDRRDRADDRVRRPARRPTALGESPAPLLVRPRGWHLPERHVAGRRRADLRRPLRLRPVRLPQRRAGSLDRGSGPYLYLPKLESHLEARLWNDVFCFARGRARPPARHDQGDRPDRDDPGRVRDGRDPLRAARPRGRAQRRPLGLHLQHHQEVPERGRSSCCPIARR